MRPFARMSFISCLLPVLFILSWAAFAVASGETGVTVESVAPRSSGARAGVQPGDLLLAWSRTEGEAPAEGSVSGYFDWQEVEGEQGPRGAVRVRGSRDKAILEFTLVPGRWDLVVRPVLSEEAGRMWAEARALVEAGRQEEGARVWSALGDRLAGEGRADAACWARLRSGEAFSAARKWAEAHQVWSQALESARQIGHPAALEMVYTDEANTWLRQADRKSATAAFREALRVRETAGETLALARTLDSMGICHRVQIQLAEMEDCFRKGLAIRSRLAPGSLEEAWSLLHVGMARWRAEDMSAAMDFYRRALAIQERLAPESLDLAASLKLMGEVFDDTLDLEQAESYYRRALAVREKVTPGNLDVAASLSDLGILTFRRGDLQEAEECQRRALAIREKMAPGSLPVAISLNMLGEVLAARSDPAGAQECYGKALAIRERLTPGSIHVSHSLMTMGSLALETGDLARARECLEKSLAIREKLESGSVLVGRSLAGLGRLAHAEGDLALARERLEKALDIFLHKVPSSLDEGECRTRLGEILLDAGESETARKHLEAAVVMAGHLAPGSLREAEGEYLLGRLERQKGDLEKALQHLQRAVSALESQTGRLGGTEENRASFRASYGNYYRELEEILIALNRDGEAFAVIERSHARQLLRLVAERDLRFGGDISPELDRRRLLADRVYEEKLRRLAAVDPTRKGEVDRLREELLAARMERSEVSRLVRTASPRLAALRYPEPLSLEGARTVLEPGSILLSFSVGRAGSTLFVLDRERGLHRVDLPLGERVLREKVEGFIRFVRESGRDSRLAVGARTRGEELYSLLLKPAEPWIRNARHLVVAPDGPLHALPFSALVRNVKGGRPEYLAGWKPLSVTLSATALALLRSEREEEASRQAVSLAAFGDPVYSAFARQALRGLARGSDQTFIQDLVLRGADWSPLPASREEVRRVSRLYPRSRSFLGSEATEENAKSEAPGARILHFACHAFLDEREPLNSALLLTLPDKPEEGRENGILQAWEILERVRLRADLVTLSACGTALGKELGGEGLVGLSQAFSYAGARSVLASLWSVSDEATAVLMERFYRGLSRGLAKDEALREAQMELAKKSGVSGKGGAMSLPFFWAAFQISGDWR